jgi:CheY-like chemotaxis protein
MIIVEDEPIICLMIEGLADELGWTSLGSASNECEARRLLEQALPSVAVLDINLSASTTSIEIASICRTRGVPVLFITAYTAAALPEACGDAPILAKPFSAEDFGAALRRCVPSDC